MDYQRLQQLTNKVLLKVNTEREYLEYLRLHCQLAIELKRQPPPTEKSTRLPDLT